MEIIIYTIPTCAWCKKLKEWLKKKRFRFEERDVYEEDKYREELLGKSNQLAVPLIDVDGEIIVGFEEEKLLKIIETAKEKKVVVVEEDEWRL